MTAEDLTQLQTSVLQCAADGMMEEAMSQKLGKTRAQIVYAKGQAYRKLGQRNFAAAVAEALRRGIIQ